MVLKNTLLFLQEVVASFWPIKLSWKYYSLIETPLILAVWACNSQTGSPTPFFHISLGLEEVWKRLQVQSYPNSPRNYCNVKQSKKSRYNRNNTSSINHKDAFQVNTRFFLLVLFQISSYVGLIGFLKHNTKSRIFTLFFSREKYKS